MIKRVDANQSEIVAALRKVGASVFDLHEVGRGCPDLLVGWHNGDNKVNYLMEVKAPKGRLTVCEDDFFITWRGQVVIVHSVAEALAVLGIGEN